MDAQYPSKSRAYKALLVAPLLPVFLLFLAEAFWRSIQLGPLAIIGAAIFAFYVLIVMEVVAALIGTVLVKLLWNRIPFSLPICAFLGGGIACLPMFMLSMFAVLPDQASVAGRATIIDGQRTPQWYWELGETMLTCFIFGAVGGFAFWAYCRYSKIGKPKEG